MSIIKRAFGLSSHSPDEQSSTLSSTTTTAKPGFTSTMEKFTPREALVERIVQRVLESRRVVLIRGTPASGKTVLCQLIQAYIPLHYPDIHLTCFPAGLPCCIDAEGSYLHSVDKMLEKTIIEEMGHNPLIDSPPYRTILLIDEAQTTYPSKYFWNTLVKTVNDGNISRFSIVMFSSYGSADGPAFNDSLVQYAPTPPSLDLSQRIEMQWRPLEPGILPTGLLLTSEESMDLLHRACIHHYERPVLTDNLKKTLCELSGGHAGVLAGLFETIISSTEFVPLKRKGSTYIIDSNSFADLYLKDPTSQLLRDRLFRHGFRRGLPTAELLRERPAISHVLRTIICRGESSQQEIQNILSQKIDPAEALKAIETCWIHGFLHKTLKLNSTEQTLLFPSKVHAWHASSLLASSPAKVSYSSSLALAEALIGLFRPSYLTAPPRRMCTTSGHLEGEQPVEDVFAYAFYQAASELLVGDWLISPQVGTRGVKGKGCIDFYFGAPKWGFELLKERTPAQIKEHYERFLPGGRYHEWILKGHLSEFLVIDFRTTVPKKAYTGMTNLLFACFASDYNSVEFLDCDLTKIGAAYLIEGGK